MLCADETAETQEAQEGAHRLFFCKGCGKMNQYVLSGAGNNEKKCRHGGMRGNDGGQ